MSGSQNPGWEIPRPAPLPNWPGLTDNYSFTFQIQPDLDPEPAPRFNSNKRKIILIATTSIIFGFLAFLYHFFL